MPPPLQRHETRGLRNVNLVHAVLGFCVAGEGGLAPHLLRHKTTVLRRVAGQGGSQQTCLLCHTADMSAVCHTGRVCRVTQQTRLLYHTEDTSAGYEQTPLWPWEGLTPQ